MVNISLLTSFCCADCFDWGLELIRHPCHACVLKSFPLLAPWCELHGGGRLCPPHVLGRRLRMLLHHAHIYVCRDGKCMYYKNWKNTTYSTINSSAIVRRCPHSWLWRLDACHSCFQSLSAVWCIWFGSGYSQSWMTCFQAFAPSLWLMSGTTADGSTGVGKPAPAGAVFINEEFWRG